jgi:hypothetical protein
MKRIMIDGLVVEKKKNNQKYGISIPQDFQNKKGSKGQFQRLTRGLGPHDN